MDTRGWEADLIRSLEGCLRGLRTSFELQMADGLDDADVQAECRIHAWTAAKQFRHKNPLATTKELRRYARRAAVNHHVTLLRRGSHVSRCAKHDWQRGTVLADTSLFYSENHPTSSNPETEVLGKERRVLMGRTLRRFPGVSWDGKSGRNLLNEADRQSHRRSRRWRKEVNRLTAWCWRRRDLLPSVDEAVEVLGTKGAPERGKRMASTFMSMTLEDLGRFVLAQRDVLGEEVTDLDREVLTKQANTIMANLNCPGQSPPECFGREFDPGDPVCVGDGQGGPACILQKACGPCLAGAGFQDLEIEKELDALVQLKAKPKAPPPAPKPEAKKAAPPKKKKKPKAKKPKVENVPTLKPKKTTTRKSVQEKTNPTRTERGDPLDPNYRPLSERRGIFPKGRDSYKLKADGSRWTRAPQGCASTMAALPVGAEVYRVWKGREYMARKTQAGDPKAVRSRDGLWELVGSWAVDENHQRTGEMEPWPLEVVASLNAIAKAITGTRNWSGSRFFSILPETLHKTMEAAQ